MYDKDNEMLMELYGNKIYNNILHENLILDSRDNENTKTYNESEENVYVYYSNTPIILNSDDNAEGPYKLNNTFFKNKVKNLLVNKGKDVEILKRIINDSHFKPEQDIIIQKFMSIKGGINVRGLERVIERLKYHDVIKNAILTNTDTIFDIKKVILPICKQIVNIEQDAVVLFDTLWNISGNVDTVSYGKGEIVLSLLSSAIKGSPGDILFNDHKVEVKGYAGRPGKDPYAHGATEKIKEVLLSGDYDLSSIHLQIQSLTNTGGKNYITQYNKLIEYLEKKQYHNTELYNNIVNIEASDNRSDIDMYVELCDSIIEDEQSDVNVSIDFVNKFNKFVELKIDYISMDVSILMGDLSWGRLVNMFFKLISNGDIKIDTATIIDVLLETRTSKLNESEVNQIRNGIIQCISTPQFNSSAMIMAIQVVSYAIADEFDKILICNDRKLDVVNCISINITNDISENTARIYNIFNTMNFKFDLSIDHRNKGAQIKLNA